ncbi:histidine phosphatase family protein [Lactococcus lactis]|uniref:histidine phosphatase family protein n=1 Tax=Lactococcus lactis TaxID=1358 RepID=UPI00207CFA5D|nr:histidine phosphatase family protein [Lactococcus lactis]MCO0817481.1 phosphoglycerate mutase family protein [Lactococcus lactis]
MTTTIYFIRHADSPFIFGEERSRPLSLEGNRASINVAKKLDDVKFDQYISSSYKRAIQTIEPLANNKTILLFDELREKRLKGNYKLDKQIIENTIRESFSDKSLKLEGGESTKEVQDRALPIIMSILKDKSLKTVAIGTHGNILTCILNYFDDAIGFEFWKASSKPDIYKCLYSETELLKIERMGIES